MCPFLFFRSVELPPFAKYNHLVSRPSSSFPYFYEKLHAYLRATPYAFSRRRSLPIYSSKTIHIAFKRLHQTFSTDSQAAPLFQTMQRDIKGNEGVPQQPLCTPLCRSPAIRLTLYGSFRINAADRFAILRTRFAKRIVKTGFVISKWWIVLTKSILMLDNCIHDWPLSLSQINDK